MIVKQNSKKPLVVLILFLIVMGIITLFYIFHNDGMKKLNKNKTFEEMLEYSNSKWKTQKPVYRTAKEIYRNDNLYIPELPPDYVPTAVPTAATPVSEAKKPQKTEADYKNLLTEMKQYPTRTEEQVQKAVNKLLVFKGYPENTVKVVATELDQSRAKSHENYMVANFDFSSGNLRISPKMLYQLDNKVLIAILAHELDHFDKLANICKSMGIDQFTKLFNDNNISVNSMFWQNAAAKANDSNFDSKLYQEALKRFITQNDVERTSSYADFYRLTENMRNPLEVNAYKESDYVYNFYGLTPDEGPIKKLARKFNDVDWAVYNAASSKAEIKNERVAMFDLFFSKAVLDLMPQFNREYQNCMLNKNGDLTDFWLAYEKSVSSFYQRGAMMDNDTYKTIYS